MFLAPEIYKHTNTELLAGRWLGAMLTICTVACLLGPKRLGRSVARTHARKCCRPVRQNKTRHRPDETRVSIRFAVAGRCGLFGFSEHIHESFQWVPMQCSAELWLCGENT